MPRHQPLLLAALLTSMTAVGCSDLEPITVNECGNHVVEGANGEDCDGGPHCHGPDQPGACRFVCDQPEDCPSGFGCGVDHVCRRASGSYQVAIDAPAAPTMGLVLGDLDHDGRRDVVRLSTDTTLVHFFGDELVETETNTLLGAPSLPLLTDLTNNGMDDLALRVYTDRPTGGLAVFRSRAGRSLVSTTYSSISLKNQNEARILSIDALDSPTPEEMLGFLDVGVYGIVPGKGKSTLVSGAPDASELAGVAVEDFNVATDSTPGEEVAFTYSGDSKVYLLEPCMLNGDNKLVWATTTPSKQLSALPSVALGDDYHVMASADQAGAAADRLFAVDWNGDSHLDLMIVAVKQSEPNEPKLRIAYGVGDGTFDSNSTPAEPCDMTAAELTIDHGCSTDVPVPLALEDFNADGLLDIVARDMLLVSDQAAGGYQGLLCNTSWSAVVAARFNDQGGLDVVAARAQEPGLDFLDGTGTGLFSFSVLPTKRPVTRLATGDFDGDLLADLAFAQPMPDPTAPDGADDTVDVLEVSYGRPAGSPEPPIKLGELAAIEQIVSGPLQGSDSAEDLMVLSRREPPADIPLGAAIVIGDGDRQLHAPFIFRVALGANATPLWVVSGRFSADASEPALAVMTADKDIDKDIDDGTRRLWLLRSSGDAQADLSIPMGAPQAFSGCLQCVPAAVDLVASDGVDEVVTFEAGMLTMFEVDGDKLVESSSVSMPSSFWISEAGGPILRPLVEDVDRDSRQDVVIMGAESEVLIFWNDGSLEAWADGGGDSVTVIASPSGESTTAFALLNADDDPELELVLLSKVGVRLVQQIGSREFQPADEAAILATSPLVALAPGGDVIAAGDLDGDGVDDLVIGDGAGFTVLAGGTVRP